MMKKGKIFLVLFTLMTILNDPAQSRTAALKDDKNNQWLFNRANTAYRQEEFESARALYEKIIQNGIKDPVVFFNLGNTCYKLQKYEYAILYYEKALKLRPSDNATRINLKLARLNILDKEDSAVNPFKVVWEVMVNLFPVNTWFIISFLLLNILFLTFILPVMATEKKVLNVVRKSRTVLIIVLLVSATLTVFSIQKSERNDRVVMMAEEVQVMGSPSDNGQNIFLIHKGTSVRVLQEANGWANISINSKLNGWVKTETYSRI
jgi:hypothetical protein